MKLVPMNASEYESFMDMSMRLQAQDHVIAGHWKAEEADAKMIELKERFLPDGLYTPNHFFFSLIPDDEEEKVGSLWFAVMEQEGKRFLFVFDIIISPEYRRHGYATQAFLQMEEKAKEMNISMIVLNVAKHNPNARAMYEKLGYIGETEEMVKML